MRLTINLQEDQYATVKYLARERDGSISAVVNELIAKALAPAPVRREATPRPRNGLPISRGARPITSEDVHKADDATL